MKSYLLCVAMASFFFLPSTPVLSPAFRARQTSIPTPLHSQSLSLNHQPVSSLSCRAENNAVSGGCCGGNSTGAGSCSSHRKPADDLSNVGKEFEAMVADATLREFEKDYVTGEMQGSITKEIMQDVMTIYPNTVESSKGEKFLDIDALLSKAKNLSKNGDFVFSAEMDEMFV